MGLLAVPVAWYRHTYLPALAVGVVIHLALAILILRAIPRILPRVPTLVALLATVLVMRFAEFVFELLPVVAIFLVVELADRRGRDEPINGPLVLVAGTVTSALAALVKFSVGISFGAVFVLAVLALSNGTVTRRLVTVAASVVGVVAANVALFSLVTRHPGSYGRYLRDSLDLASGYQAMALSDRVGSRAAFDVVVISLSALACVVGALSQPSMRRRGWLALMVFVVVYFTDREGLQRHDPTHIDFILGALLILPLALPSPNRLGRLSLGLTVLALLLTGAAYSHRLIDVTGSLSQAATAARATYSAAITEQAQARVRAEQPLPPDVLSQLRGHRVQVTPFEADITYGYGLQWDPIDVYQLYSAYTPRLDQEDAQDLLGPAGPDRVLAQTPANTIDSRFAFGEAPAFQLALFCNFTPVVLDQGWEVLRRTSNHCGRARTLSPVTLRPGAGLSIPAAPASSLVIAHITLDLPISQRIEASLAKAGYSYLRLNGVTYRMVIKTAPDGIIVAASPGLFSPADSSLLSNTTLEYNGPATAAHVSFSIVPVTGAGAFPLATKT